jgi:hypothetical protein
MGTLLSQILSAKAEANARSRAAGKREGLATVLVRTTFFGLTRLSFAAFVLLTSVYCLLVWVPFSYFGFIRNPLMDWIPVFVRLHGLLYGVLLGAVAITLISDFRDAKMRRSAIAFLVLNGCVALYLWHQDALAGLHIGLECYFWSVLSLFPVIWLAAIDLSKENSLARKKPLSLEWAQPIIAGVAVTIAFAAMSALRGTWRDIPRPFVLQAVGATLSFHVFIFTLVGLILVLIAHASRKVPWAGVVLTRAFAWLVLTELLRKIVLPTISLQGALSDVYAALVSFALVFSTTAFADRFRSLSSHERFSMERVSRSWLMSLATLGLLASAYTIPVLLERTDWDFALQRTAVILVWLATLQAVSRSGLRPRGKIASIAAFLVMVAAGVAFACYGKFALYNPNPSPELQEMLDTYSGADISFRTADDILSRPMDDGAHKSFYEFLKRHTNLGSDVTVAPADTRLVADLRPTPGIKPNIFLFVIDSLRQDYVFPYNPGAIDYAPKLADFARDSIVMQQAFTRYGGTALSEPAIWVGAMQLHKQYIQPFYPMNNLQKLLETDGYQSYISIDPILGFTLRQSPSITELNSDTILWGQLDFVSTLTELQQRIDARSDKNKPIFAYSQPQNVHTLTLERSKIKGGRKAVSIYELRRMDAAFGEFVNFLKKRGLYDNSIIILTADHGDCYGEFGRYGHSDFLFPQIVKVPLIFHLPPKMRDRFVWDEHQVAFASDITPSLYYLLGHTPIINREVLGRPLFTETNEEASAYARSHYLLVSSYAPVYAVLGGHGESLFIVDAVNSRNYYYNLVTDPGGAHNRVTAQLRDMNEAIIRHDVGLVDDFYNWHPPQQ